MSDLPLRCVVDTNVATTANGANPAASAACMAASAIALEQVRRSGHVFVDAGGLIFKEYLRNLRPKGEPGVGDAFMKWFLDNHYNPARCTRVPITQTAEDEFAELPTPADGTHYDGSDRKFLAVAAAHPEHPPILQSFDAKWWGWQAALATLGVRIHFVCPEDIERQHDKKMGAGQADSPPPALPRNRRVPAK